MSCALSGALSGFCLGCGYWFAIHICTCIIHVYNTQVYDTVCRLLYIAHTCDVYRSELPSTQYESLRVELFAAIARCSARGPRLVLIQLCRCMVAFAFATMSDVWPNTIVSMVHSLKDATQSVQVC